MKVRMMNTRFVSKGLVSCMFAALLFGGAAHAAGATPAIANQDEPEMEEQATENTAESSQPVRDAWITTKVKTELLANDETTGTGINVETVNGVVHLSGEVPSQAEFDRADEIARGIEGVLGVDTSGLTYPTQ
ncbi:BON domain-containing protein [Marilutibacter alkalisoli]|nr:BON domain-containing protein [Lysobacter alkalisoli]